jgi:hypothetical protein
MQGRQNRDFSTVTGLFSDLAKKVITEHNLKEVRKKEGSHVILEGSNGKNPSVFEKISRRSVQQKA